MGWLHFAMDTWSSPNHWVFVAWTVHLKHKGHMLGFLLDIIKVAEVYDLHSLLLCQLLMPISFLVSHQPHIGKSILEDACTIWAQRQGLFRL